MNTFNWTIAQLDCIPELDGVQDYVVTVHWRYGITNGTYSTDIYGAQGFPQSPESENFIPFAELTEADVIGWLENSLDVPSMQTNLTTALDNIINPPIVSPPLPWL